ncbi:hypothetical protein K438DRAFT_731245 [Mycena galopus ATCC 62051]|nr:hypothetical protein K438DRAFT_731245 [Mycena galopus ATCC 62051]
MLGSYFLGTANNVRGCKYLQGGRGTGVRYHTSQFESPGDAKAIGKTQLRRTFLCGGYSFPCSATEYIFGTTKNPLVVGLDDKTNSDERILGSDGNVTMILGASHPAHASNINLCIDSQILQSSLHPHAQAFVFVSAAISRSWPGSRAVCEDGRRADRPMALGAVTRDDETIAESRMSGAECIHGPKVNMGIRDCRGHFGRGVG